MKLDLYQVDAFTNKLFAGNPAAVVPLEEWLDDQTLLNIAAENNLSETAFFVKKNDRYSIRWMTPTVEIPLCGHATLASSFVIFNYLEKDSNQIRFDSKSGELIVTRDGDLITLNFPSNKPEKVETPDELIKALGAEPLEVYYNKSYLALLGSETEVRRIKPDVRLLKSIHSHGLIITAQGENYDCVSRFFIPSAGIDEDPVTGFAHTILTPYWSDKLGKKKLKAFQASKRGGEIICEDLGDRVKLSGTAILYMKGEIYL
ncbi:MAG: PhzF family phenazine biosynthesis protein [Melioribacteraceae bacterium]|nr:PhzF family phenazine biosynthesis protein [Melioribacteraceae bacterium]MCF8266158.1 PhzF family phenazine biosynthesis protein [Melioribacteraceae bacterium]MCF8430657.1 PhzF family phenazine biosynthesis protein [Melioribacteraceae bacterium]